MQILKSDEIADFLARFSDFYDAILHGFSCAPGSETSCELSFEAQDENSVSGWSMVTIRLQNLISWKFAVSMNCAFYIISNGVHLHYQNELFYMDVNELYDPSEKTGDYLDSDFHYVARAIWWEATEIE